MHVHPRAAPAPPPASPRIFFTISTDTKSMVHIDFQAPAGTDREDLLGAIYNFIAENPRLDEGNIFLTKYKNFSILIESFGRTLFAQVFDGEVERPHYKGFHKTVKYAQKVFPEIAQWDGNFQSLPVDYRSNLMEYLFRGRELPRQTAPAAPAGAQQTAGPAGDARPEKPPPQPEAPDLEAYEAKMREWYSLGYNIEPLKNALHEELPVLVRAFKRYEVDLEQLKALRVQVDELELEGFDADISALRAMLKDTARIQEAEEGIEALVVKIREKYSIRLPVEDRWELGENIKALPLGIPSALWGIPLEILVEDILSAEKALTTEGKPVVKLKGKWYLADGTSSEFLTLYKGTVQTPRDLLIGKSKLKGQKLDELLDKILGPDGLVRRV